MPSIAHTPEDTRQSIREAAEKLSAMGAEHSAFADQIDEGSRQWTIHVAQASAFYAAAAEIYGALDEDRREALAKAEGQP